MGNITGIDTTGGCWLCTGVAIELLIFLGTALFFTAIAFKYAEVRAWPYYVAGTAWLLFVAYEFGIARVNSIHWYFGILAIGLAIAMFFMGATGGPKAEEPPPKPGTEYWQQKRERENASKARRGKL